MSELAVAFLGGPRLFPDFPETTAGLTFAGARRIVRRWFGGNRGAGRDMKKQPKKKLSINKETIRRLSPTELALIRGGQDTDVPTPSFPDQQDIGTYRECIL